jgi:hypothetical protein
MLVLGESRIRELNGPASFTSLELKSRYEGILPTKYMIFLGDEHSYTNFTKCDRAGCVEAKLEFIDMLNDFGKRENNIDIQFFSEEFQVTKQKLSLQAVNYNDMKKDLIMSDINHPSGVNTNKKLMGQLSSKGMSNRSDMLDFNKIYANCFARINGRCSHANIEWHYADLRKRPTQLKNLSSDNFELYCDMSSKFNLIVEYINQTELQKKIDVLSIEDYSDYDKPDHTVMTYINDIDQKHFSIYLDFLRIMFNDRAEFVRRALTSYTLNKQYGKLTQSLMDIFTHDSFVELLEYNIAFLNEGLGLDFDALLEKINVLIEILQRIYGIMKSKIRDAEKTETIRTVLRERPLVFSKAEQFYIEHYYLNCGHIFMDIYFIFRSNKYRKNNLLTMSYFGSNHAKYISHYFVNIVKTHSYDYNVTNTRKRVRFTKEINLNEIMGLVPRKSALIKVRRRSTSPRRSTTRISRTGSRRSASPKASSPHSRSASPRRSATRRSETRRSSASQKAERKASSPHRTEYLQENMSSNNGIGKGNRKRRTRRRRTSGK